MKPVSLLVSALAATVAAAPAKTEERGLAAINAGFGGLDLSLLNGLNFANDNFAYLLGINALDLNQLLLLSQVNNFGLDGFGGLFNANVFDIQALLQLQQLATLLQFQSLGLFNGFDLSTLALAQLNLGLLNNVGLLDLSQFIDANSVGQISAIARQTGEYH